MGRRPGRPRKVGVPRNRKGRIAWGHDRVRPDQILSVPREARHVHGAREGAKVVINGRKREIDTTDPLWGYSLGRLAIYGSNPKREGITIRQHDAGWSFAELHTRYSAQKGFSLPNPRSPAMTMVSRGIALTPDPDKAALQALFERWAGAHKAVTQAVGLKGFHLLVQVACCDHEPSEAELGTLRMALNALAKHFRL